MRQIAATRRGDKSPRLHCCCDKSLALSLSLRCVAQIQTSLNLCDGSQRQNSVAATIIFTSHEAICCSKLSRRHVAAICRIVCLGLYGFTVRGYSIWIPRCFAHRLFYPRTVINIPSFGFLLCETLPNFAVFGLK